jgi:hypothetical protein
MPVRQGRIPGGMDSSTHMVSSVAEGLHYKAQECHESPKPVYIHLKVRAGTRQRKLQTFDLGFLHYWFCTNSLSSHRFESPVKPWPPQPLQAYRGVSLWLSFYWHPTEPVRTLASTTYCRRCLFYFNYLSCFCSENTIGFITCLIWCERKSWYKVSLLDPRRHCITFLSSEPTCKSWERNAQISPSATCSHVSFIKQSQWLLRMSECVSCSCIEFWFFMIFRRFKSGVTQPTPAQRQETSMLPFDSQIVLLPISSFFIDGSNS